MQTPRERSADKDTGAGARRGRLRIGDDWNAITIIALSQSNPLKAVAEFVENAIDAGARHVTIARGREQGMHTLRIADDGEGVPRDAEGAPDFRYVATHICDSLKRRLKERGASSGIQGEFGIGLLSFWTVGEELLMTSGGADGRVYQMHMRRNDPGFSVSARRSLVEHRGTELKIRPLLAGIRHFSGEKIQWYLAAELRDRIRSSGVRITVVDHQARREYRVEPREFNGRLLHELPGAPGAPLEVGANGAEDGAEEPRQKQFFEFAGPLHSVQIAPVSCVVPVDSSRRLRAVARDRAKRLVESGVTCMWSVNEGAGTLDPTAGEHVEYRAPAEPGLARVRAHAPARDRLAIIAEGRFAVWAQPESCAK